MNNYHFYEEEAKGSLSVIFKARRKRKLDFVAIKRTEKSRKSKVTNEAKILADLSHQNIIKFHEYIESKNHMWAVTEYCPGGDLLKLIKSENSLPEDIVKGFMIDILNGLQYCHHKGVIICDLKSASILLNEYGNAKIGDFGSAKNLVDLLHSEKEAKKGTPSYMAPELFIDGGVYSIQSDLWSIGCIMYELSQGNPPFISATSHEIANLAINSILPEATGCSKEFNSLILALMKKDPAERITWKEICEHPWIEGQIKSIHIPEQSHFRDFLIQRQKQSNQTTKMLRISQEISKQSYKKQIDEHVDNRRSEYIFQNDNEEEEAQQHEEYFEEKANIEEKTEILPFTKKKEKLEGKVQKEKPKEKENVEDSTNVNVFLDKISRTNLIPFSEILNHQSDTAVKPIIGNKDIEVIESFSFNKNNLGFEYIEPDALAEGVVNGDMAEELRMIFDGMVGDEKYNVMGYFESIIQNSDIANFLFKEGYIKFYMRLIKGYKQAALRAKMFEIMGFLVRHATVIEPGVAKQGIIAAFIDGATKDKSEKVRRKAMAALGELLFYGATQVDEGVSEWDISLKLINSLQKILKNVDEDEIVRIYCCKSIENITAQAKDIGTKFAQFDTLMALITCFNTCTNEGFRTSICSSFHHILQLNPTLREPLLEKIGPIAMANVLKLPDISYKSVQILLWIMLFQLTKSKNSKISKMYLQDEELFRAVVSKLERTASAIAKGRIYLYIYLFLEGDPKKVIVLLENGNGVIVTHSNKLFGILQKQNHQEEKHSKYETQCLQYVLVWLVENFSLIIEFIHSDIEAAVLHIKMNSELSSINNMGYCGILLNMVNCSWFDELFSSVSGMEMIAGLLKTLDEVPVGGGEGGAWGVLEDIKCSYVKVLEKLLTSQVFLDKLQNYHSGVLLPWLVSLTLNSKHEDLKYSCIKFILYLVSYYLNENYVYDSGILVDTSNRVIKEVDIFIEGIDAIIGDGAVGVIACKFLVVCFEGCEGLVKKFHSLGKLEILINKGCLGINCNQMLLNIIIKCLPLEQPVSVPLPYQQKLFTLTTKILEKSIKTGQHIFISDCLQILMQLMRICGGWKKEDMDEVGVVVRGLKGDEDMEIEEKKDMLIGILNGKSGNNKSDRSKGQGQGEVPNRYL